MGFAPALLGRPSGKATYAAMTPAVARERDCIAVAIGSAVVPRIASFTFFVIMRTKAASRSSAAGVWATVWEDAIVVVVGVIFALLALAEDGRK